MSNHEEVLWHKFIGGPVDLDALDDLTEGDINIAKAFFQELAREAAVDPDLLTPEEEAAVRSIGEQLQSLGPKLQAANDEEEATEATAVQHLRERFEQLKAMSPEEQHALRERLLREWGSEDKED